MKIAVIIVRVLLGLLFLFGSVVFLFNLAPQPPLQGPMKVFNEGLTAAGYVMPVVKVIELICAICFLTGRFVPLATVVIFPITVNIVLVHAFLAPEGLPMGIGILLANLFLAYSSWNNYKSLLALK
jgi:uncharacterized membrane protein YphA (DoxX/SURF4 family)